MQGGIERQSAAARIVVSTAVLGLIASLAQDGYITGIEEGDYKEATARGAVRPAMSIRVGDEWVSYAGFDPIAGQLAAAATAVDRYKNDSSYPIVDTIQAMTVGMAGALAQSSYAEGLAGFVEALLEGFSAAKEGGEAGPIVRNALVSTATVPLNPNFVRWMNQEFFDPQQRDATGDNTVAGRILARTQSAWPGMSTDLPQAYDVFGRPMQNMRQERYVEQDPAVLEINRLEREYDKLVMGRPKKTVNINGEDRELTGAEFQAYQHYTGYYALEDIRAVMDSGEWAEMNDDERLELVAEILEDVRLEGREALFGHDRDYWRYDDEEEMEE
jgi:hypothetical protein